MLGLLEGDVNPDVDCTLPSPVNEGNVVDMNDFSSLSVNEIQKLVDKELRDYTNPWKGSIMLLVHPLTQQQVTYSHSFDEEPQLVDVVDYLGGDGRVLRDEMSKVKPLIARLYFPPSEFPPPKIDVGKWVFLKL